MEARKSEAQHELELAQLEAFLHENGQPIQAVWENASDAMAISAPDGTVLAANPAYFQLYGYAKEAVIGKNFAIIFPVEHRAVAQQLYTHFFQSPAISPSFEGTVMRSDGAERFVESSYSFITQNGRRIAMISIVRDITARKKVEEELHISRLKLHLALEMAQLGSWDWDMKTDTIMWSTNLEVALGLVPGISSLRYATFLEMVHPEDRPLIEQKVQDACEKDADYEVDFRLLGRNDTIYHLRAVGEVISDDDGKPLRMVGVCQRII